MASRTAGVRGISRLLIAELTGAAKAVRRNAHDTPARTACGGGEAPECAPCRGPAQPACRSPARAALRGLRVACRPPPHAARPPCPAPASPCPLTCERHTHSTLKGFAKEDQCKTGPGGRCGDTMDRVAQRISAARLARRREYEQEVADRAARPPAPPAPAVPAAYRLAAGREVVRATDGRDYVVLPPLGSSAPKSHQKCDHDKQTSTVELDPAKSCVINRSPHVDPCAHRPRLLLQIDRNEISETAQIPPPQKTSPESPLDATQNQKNYSGLKVPKKYCKGSAFSPLTDWCSSRPKIEPESPGCRQPSLVEKIKRRSNSYPKELRKFHTVPSLLLQSVKAPEHNGPSENEIRAVIDKVKADTQKLNKMLTDRAELKEAGRGRNTNSQETEEVSASGQLELRAPADGAGVRVRVSLLGAAASPRSPARNAHNTHPVCPAAGADRDPSYYGKCDSWLSIKNIQKKLTGCRKDTAPTKQLDNDNSSSQNPPSKEIKRSPGASPCTHSATQKRPPCERKQPSPDTQCQPKQPQKSPPCGGARPASPASRCRAVAGEFLPDATVIV